MSNHVQSSRDLLRCSTVFFGALSPVPERVATIDAWKFEGVLRDPGWDRDCQGPSSHVKISACYKWDKSGYVPRIYISQMIIIH